MISDPNIRQIQIDFAGEMVDTTRRSARNLKRMRLALDQFAQDVAKKGDAVQFSDYWPTDEVE